MLKQIIKSIVPKPLWKDIVETRNNWFRKYITVSYSQEGEDLILNKIFAYQDKGFYVDVGAHHPKKYSNTYIFYKRGWRGINIDAMPGSMKLFNKIRPRDINIEKAVSDKKEVLTYYVFNQPAVNGFSKELSEDLDATDNYSIQFTKDIETLTLEEILDNNLRENQRIDFLSIDVEGLDYKVLKSTNLDKYRPRVILLEILGSSLQEIEENEISHFLKAYNFSLYAKAINSVLFIDNNFLREKGIKFERSNLNGLL